MKKEQAIILKVHKLNLLLVGEAKEEYSQVLQDALSLIKEQQEDIEKYKTLYERALSDVVKTDKQIDLMAEQLAGLTIWNSKKGEPLILTDKEDVKQYFEQKVKSSKQ